MSVTVTQYTGYRIVAFTVPAGTDALTDLYEAKDSWSRPTLLETPNGWQTSHIDAHASMDGSTFTRIWSTNSSGSHFVTSIAASQAMQMFSQNHRGAYRYFKFHIITDQLVERSIKVLFIDDYYTDANPQRVLRASDDDDASKGGGKA